MERILTFCTCGRTMVVGTFDAEGDREYVRATKDQGDTQSRLHQFQRCRVRRSRHPQLSHQHQQQRHQPQSTVTLYSVRLGLQHLQYLQHFMHKDRTFLLGIPSLVHTSDKMSPGDNWWRQLVAGARRQFVVDHAWRQFCRRSKLSPWPTTVCRRRRRQFVATVWTSHKVAEI